MTPSTKKGMNASESSQKEEAKRLYEKGIKQQMEEFGIGRQSAILNLAKWGVYDPDDELFY